MRAMKVTTASPMNVPTPVGIIGNLAPIVARRSEPKNAIVNIDIAIVSF